LTTPNKSSFQKLKLSNKQKTKNLKEQQIQIGANLPEIRVHCQFIEDTLKNGTEMDILALHPSMMKMKEYNQFKWRIEPSEDDSISLFIITKETIDDGDYKAEMEEHR